MQSKCKIRLQTKWFKNFSYKLWPMMLLLCANNTSEKLRIQPTLIQLKTWYFLQKLIVCLLSFDLFISSKVSRLHNFYTVLIVCITLHQSFHWLLLFSDQQQQHDNKERKRIIPNWIQCGFTAYFLSSIFISHLYMLCIHALQWPLRISFSEMERSTLAISCALLITAVKS